MTKNDIKQVQSVLDALRRTASEASELLLKLPNPTDRQVGWDLVNEVGRLNNWVDNVLRPEVSHARAKA